MTTTFAGLLLDIGGPMIRLPFEFLDEIEHSYGLAPGTITLRGPFGPGVDRLWRDRDTGLLSEREYWRLWVEEIGKATQRSCDLGKFFATCYGLLGPEVVRGEATALAVDAQAAGFRVGALTNDVSWFLSPELIPRFSILSELDAFVDLSHAEVRKPDPQAYAIALDALGLAPGQVLFVDDHPRYVTGAEVAGLPALHFDITDAAGSIRRIRDRLGLPA
ncbi:MAG: HAD-IA family hydrolase [Pseudonocardiaceae bacterium]